MKRKRIASRLFNILLLMVLCYLIFTSLSARKKAISISEVPQIYINEEDDLFVNTTGCRISSTKPLSLFALPFMEPIEPIVCGMEQLMIAETIGDRNYLVRNISKLGMLSWRQVSCVYRQFVRVDDAHNKYISLKFFKLSDGTRYLEVGTGLQYIRTWCWVDFGRIIFHDVLFFLPPPPPATNRSTELQKRKLSVMILGVDSISHMHYMRYFHRVADFIEHLPHTEFWGYNRVALNTYPNLMPLVSGLSVSEMESSCYKGELNFDKCNFLWNEFKRAGYSTIFAEDTDTAGLFTYRKRGYKKEPTDIYMRPLMTEIEAHSLYRTKYDLKCTGHRLYGEYYYEFVSKLIPHVERQLYFSFLWNMHGIHDIFQYAKFVDKDYLSILTRLRERGVMENTLILFMGDHGLRFDRFARTAPGQHEMSQPLLIAIYPEWLKRRFPLAMSNFERNARSLITTFDLHKTLEDVIHLDRLTDANVRNRTLNLVNGRGISLFLPIPQSRDCETAEIPQHYCLCNKLTSVSTHESSVQEAASFAVNRINELIKPYPQCRVLSLQAVRAAYRAKDDYRGNYRLSQIMVRLKTTPGDGNFDATVLITMLNSERKDMQLGGPVTRTDRYAHQAFCVQNYRIEMYCYCL
ncbi:uncharacterized protein LOC120448173 [Drosophila santomea]|uniref:uncharacterized protein LOC120448173 n=1 Tax=Drosophila santomea TaxID=129105 RepID=UPI001954467C|nr:uncharacterized protein LOC120448173 [Drosophila santomea]